MIHQYTEQKAENPDQFPEPKDYCKQFVCSNLKFTIVKMDYEGIIWYKDEEDNIKSDEYSPCSNLTEIMNIMCRLPDVGEWLNLASKYNEKFKDVIKNNKVHRIPLNANYFCPLLWSSLICNQICHGSKQKPCGLTHGININCSNCAAGAHIQCLQEMGYKIDQEHEMYICEKCSKNK